MISFFILHYAYALVFIVVLSRQVELDTIAKHEFVAAVACFGDGGYRIIVAVTDIESLELGITSNNVFLIGILLPAMK